MNNNIEVVTAAPMLARAELDQQVATAKAYPRSIAKFKAVATEMATLDVDTAASCFYSLPRGGKAVEGPSIRLAEIIGSAWGNLNYGSRIVSIEDKFLTAQGICRDLERNVTMTAEVTRRITNKHGQRFNDDMIGVTANAACSIALRNAIFKVIPMAYAKDILAKARQVAIGDARTLNSRRAAMIDYFGKMGVAVKRILWLLNKPSVDDIGLDDMQLLVGLTTAIKDGDTTVDEAFPTTDPNAPAPKQDEPPKSKAEAKAAKAAKVEPEPPAETPESAPDAKPEPEATTDAPEPEPDVLTEKTKVYVRRKGKIRVTRTVDEMDAEDWNDAYTEAKAVIDNPDEPVEAKNHAAGVIVLLEANPVQE